MLTSGYYHSLKIQRFTPHGAFLNNGEDEVLLPQRYLTSEMEVGQVLDLFVYTDSEDRLVATTETPLAIAGEMKPLQLKALTSFGAFFDWGLSKDLLVPKREMLPGMQEGKSYVVMVLNDPQSNRVVGSCLINSFLEKADEDMEISGQYDVVVYEITELGYRAIVDGKYQGMLYKNEVFQTLHLGDVVKAKIHQAREDGKLDLKIVADKQDLRTKILIMLEEEGGKLPYHDKSDPDEIYRAFGVSKKVFKAAIGGLYKEQKIVINKDGISLVR